MARPERLARIAPKRFWGLRPVGASRLRLKRWRVLTPVHGPRPRVARVASRSKTAILLSCVEPEFSYSTGTLLIKEGLRQGR